MTMPPTRARGTVLHLPTRQRRCRLVAVVALSLLVGACTVSPPAPAPAPVEPVDSGPAGPVDRAALERLPDPPVVAEPRSHTGNTSPYVVFGTRYEVMPESDDYSVDGRASWYGSKFHGRRTSSGEKYDMYALTAAHRSLPIPCYARVTNLANGRTTVVKINDRGPFHPGRLIDLSYAAAVKLGFDRAGSAWVRVETLAPASPSAPSATATASTVPPVDALRYYVQAGAFRSRNAAEVLSQHIARMTDGAPVRSNRGTDGLYRVRIGPFTDRVQAGRVQARLLGTDAGAGLILQR